MTSLLMDSQRMMLRYVLAGSAFVVMGIVYGISAHFLDAPSWLTATLLAFGFIGAHLTWRRTEWLTVRNSDDVTIEEFSKGDVSEIRKFVSRLRGPLQVDALAILEFLVHSYGGNPQTLRALGPGVFVITLQDRVHVLFAVTFSPESRTTLTILDGFIDEQQRDESFPVASERDESMAPQRVFQLIPQLREIPPIAGQFTDPQASR